MDKEINGWKYREIETRSGKKVVFGKLSDLLMNYYKVTQVGALDQYRSNYQDQYIIRCPFCEREGHTKEKLHILPNPPGTEDFDSGYCFVCGRSFIHTSNKVEVNYRVPNFLKGVCGEFEILPMTDKIWTLKKYEREFKPYSALGVKYLEKRNPYLKDLWKPLGFKFFEDHIVMPFFSPDGKLIYYQIRFIDADTNDSIRYFFPRTESKPPYIIQTSEANPEKLIFVEGIYDAIAAMIASAGKYVVIGCMGSKISDYQLEFIRNYYTPRKILVWMDDYKLSGGIAKRLKSVFNYSDIKIISSNGPDPEEILVHRLRHGLKIPWITEDYGEQKKLSYPKFGGTSKPYK